MVGPWGLLLAGPAAATTKVKGDVDGGPLGVLLVDLVVATTKVVANIDGGAPRGCCRWVR
jgi:hypothetical protein